MSPKSDVETEEGLPTFESTPSFSVVEGEEARSETRSESGEQTPNEEEDIVSARPQPSNKKYLFKLGIAGGAPVDTVYKPREERPRQHCTLIIFDWDDTLLCTSALQSTKPPTVRELQNMENEAVKLFQLAKSLGTVIIITNAVEGWVQHSCAKHMPILARHLEDAEIISARAKYEDRFPDDPTQWKVEAFCQVKENSQTIANLVALGDSTAEMAALHAMAKLYHICYTKTIKFKARPRCVELQQEICLVEKKLATIVSAVRHLGFELWALRTLLKASASDCAGLLADPTLRGEFAKKLQGSSLEVSEKTSQQLVELFDEVLKKQAEAVKAKAAKVVAKLPTTGLVSFKDTLEALKTAELPE
ncbi:unnamed protein product, partial [Effrenium voratum]